MLVMVVMVVINKVHEIIFGVRCKGEQLSNNVNVKTTYPNDWGEDFYNKWCSDLNVSILNKK